MIALYRIATIILMLFIIRTGYTQQTQTKTDKELIEETLTHYIEGTANGEPDRLKIAFHPDFNLYSVNKDSLQVWKGKDYIGNIKQGQKLNRIGRILFIDIENDAAMAKVEIVMPERKRNYTDFFLLLKYQGTWKIIHKSFSWKSITEQNKK